MKKNNHINRIKKVYALQEYYLLTCKRGIPRIRIYENISCLFPMSISTFDNYMSENVRLRIKELNIDIYELTKYKNNVIKALQLFETSIV